MSTIIEQIERVYEEYKKSLIVDLTPYFQLKEGGDESTKIYDMTELEGKDLSLYELIKPTKKGSVKNILTEAGIIIDETNKTLAKKTFEALLKLTIEASKKATPVAKEKLYKELGYELKRVAKKKDDKE